MIEIRTIQKNDIYSFLDLLCLVFHLNQKKVRAAFFSEPFFDLHRKWALFENGQMNCILTTTPLIFEAGKGVGIAGVATRPELRGKGLATKLLRAVLGHADLNGEPMALLFAQNPKLYFHTGFQVLDEVIRGPLKSIDPPFMPEYMGFKQIKEVYEKWALAHPLRLFRDQKRWDYWKYVHKPCERYSNGYLCLEGKQIREALFDGASSAWPAPKGTDWVGLRSFTEQLEVPIESMKTEMLLMGKGFKECPQLFMTDQF